LTSPGISRFLRLNYGKTYTANRRTGKEGPAAANKGTESNEIREL
jgi:hypothetical protein